MTGEITAQQDPAVGPPGGWLRRRREAAGLTQEELAEQAGLSVRTIRNLESGAGQPQLRSMRSLTAALGLPETVMSQLIVAYRGGPGNDPGIAPGGAAPAQAAAHRPGSVELTEAGGGLRPGAPDARMSRFAQRPAGLDRRQDNRYLLANR